MRTRLPTVWSSLCSVKVAAFVTLVSFSREILHEDNILHQVSSNAVKVQEENSDQTRLYCQVIKCNGDALRHAIRDDKAFESVWCVHADVKVYSKPV